MDEATARRCERGVQVVTPLAFADGYLAQSVEVRKQARERGGAARGLRLPRRCRDALLFDRLLALLRRVTPLFDQLPL